MHVDLATRKNRRRAGVSVLEVLISIVLLVLILAGAYMMVSQCAQLLLTGRDHYVATTLCLARIERARNVDYNLLIMLNEKTPVIVDQDGNISPDGRFRRKTDVSANWPANGLTMVVVKVQIKNRRTNKFDAKNYETMSCYYTVYLTPVGS
ncbi:MAG: prepilin-type N-terminal cleavage/methylation domain-containing protein [Kiritimatiellae bacterium]|nr:prepilin-type N-terminal cleavage/methylation domain-containing protein [Kiritimatiellia bacterium]